ncbi:hypothetical protein PS685_05308 [Pseudomonas fluorescens]|uniref:Uncharacterized protein n=1 Tax=Pseudomonas fluorescens TaxID=294 RepID=A0A5E7AAE5_PSEFL|nr:hypothetical protein PS685_05308 [Pseudomonas fluorescens]
MQCAKHQVTGLGSRQRETDGLQVAHLPHQNHVRVFPQRRAQGRGETAGIAMDLALVDQAFARFVNELDRVFDSKNVMVAMVVQVIDHRRQGGGLAGTGRTGHQHQATGGFCNLAKHFPHPQVFHAQHLGRDGPKHRASTAVLIEHIDAETCHTRHFKGKIGLQVLFKLHPLDIVHDIVDQLMDLLGVQCRQIDAPHIAIDANHRWQAGRQVQVGCTLFGAEGQQLSDIHSAPQFQ